MMGYRESIRKIASFNEVSLQVFTAARLGQCCVHFLEHIPWWQWLSIARWNSLSRTQLQTTNCWSRDYPVHCWPVSQTQCRVWCSCLVTGRSTEPWCKVGGERRRWSREVKAKSEQCDVEVELEWALKTDGIFCAETVVGTHIPGCTESQVKIFTLAEASVPFTPPPPAVCCYSPNRVKWYK